MMNIYHHRVELITALLNLKYNVVVAAPRGGEEKKLEELGCKFIHMPVDNRGTSIKNDFLLLRNLSKIYTTVNPDVILTFYTKTNIYGGLIARRKKIPYIENICGLGSSLASDGLLTKVMSALYRAALKKADFVFFQNKSNIKFITEGKIYKGKYGLLPGSGVSLTRYPVLPYPESEDIEFLFCSRIIEEKGIDEYLKAAEVIKKKYPSTKFHVVGPPEAHYQSVIEDFHNKGVITYHGKLMDIHPILNRTHCSIHPSYYGEGMANILLESSASGRPVITTNLPGCGEAVEDGKTGFIVKEKDYKDLAEKIEKFILLPPEEKRKMGLEGRKKMEKEFDREIITQQYIKQIKNIVK